MPSLPSNARLMPDIAAATALDAAARLDWVGMDEIAIPVRLLGEDGTIMQTPARVTAQVNLKDASARGIHMSRLYLHLDKHLPGEALSPCTLRRLLRDFLDSHAELSDRARIDIRFEQMIRRPALASDNSGWRSYPVRITATLHESAFAFELETEALYSSTCPCSAALARQLIQEQFAADFAPDEALQRDKVLAWLGSEQGIRATPHSQRSSARVRVRLAAGFEFPIVELIDLIEGALKTVVQTAVKREDEQAFAELNAANLMFCEDAARRVAAALADDARVAAWQVRVAHFESLHPHDAVAVATKGVEGGYSTQVDR
jgi:GTP cyclohydrolase I